MNRVLKDVLISLLVLVVIVTLVVFLIYNTQDLWSQEDVVSRTLEAMRREHAITGMTEAQIAEYDAQIAAEKALANRSIIERINDWIGENQTLRIIIIAAAVLVFIGLVVLCIAYSHFLFITYNFSMFGWFGRLAIVAAMIVMIVNAFGARAEIDSVSVSAYAIFAASPFCLILGIMALVKTKRFYHFLIVPAIINTIAVVAGLAGRWIAPMALGLFLLFCVYSAERDRRKPYKCGHCGKMLDSFEAVNHKCLVDD